MLQLKIKTIDIPLFGHQVNLISGEYNTTIAYLCNSYNIDVGDLDMENNKAEAITFPIKGDIYIWWEKDIDIPTLTHELIHATYFIMESRGLLLEDHEVWAYLMQYLMEESMDLAIEFINNG